MEQCPEDDGSGVLDDFQALLQELRVSVPKLDIVPSILAHRRGSTIFSLRLRLTGSRAAELKMLCILPN
jgi:hypothetical protein